MSLTNVKIRAFVLLLPFFLIVLAGCQDASQNSPHDTLNLGPSQQAAIQSGTPTSAQESGKREWDTFFADWLKAHHESKVVIDTDGVGIAGNTTRLKASRYGSNKNKNGCVLEVEFRIRLPGGGEIVEYVAGMGATEDQAAKDALVNFILTTFHVVYKSFINSSDPHQTIEEVPIGGKARKMAMGDLYMRGDKQDHPIDLNAMRQPIRDAISRLPLSGQPHWIKIVYGQDNGKLIVVSATLDNAEHESLTSAIRDLNWPKSEKAYVVKQFIVVN